MKFITVYNAQSGMWDAKNPDKQPKNHLATEDSFAALCGIKNVEWMGSEEMELSEYIDSHGICKRCLKSALKILGQELTN